MARGRIFSRSHVDLRDVFVAKWPRMPLQWPFCLNSVPVNRWVILNRVKGALRPPLREKRMPSFEPTMFQVKEVPPKIHGGKVHQGGVHKGGSSGKDGEIGFHVNL